MPKFDSKTILESPQALLYEAVIWIDRITAGRPADPEMFKTLVRIQTHKGAPGTPQYEKAEEAIAARQAEADDPAIGHSPLLAADAEGEESQGQETIKREFSRVNGAPCFRGYQVFACLRESLGTLAGNSPGYYSAFDALKKGIFVSPDYIPLEDCKKIEVQYSAGHVMGPRGDRSILKIAEVAEGAVARFRIRVAAGVPTSYFPEAALRRMLEEAGFTGIGSDRSLGSGRWRLISLALVR